MFQARDRLMTENGDLQTDLNTAKLDIERLKELLDKVQDDKRALSDKVETLIAKGWQN